MTTYEAEEMIFDFLSRVAFIMQPEYRGDIRPIRIDDLRLITTYVTDSKNGKVRRLSSQSELPFRTVSFFKNTFTDVKNAHTFFNPMNKQNAIKWLRENILQNIRGGFNILDWCGNGRLAHVDAIRANYSSVDSNSRNEI